MQRLRWFGWTLIFAILICPSLQGSETIEVKVPGGTLKGRVKSINEKEVLLVLQDGNEQPIPIQFLSQEQLSKIRTSMIDQTDANALYKHAEKLYLDGNKTEAYRLFEKIGAQDPSKRAQITALIRGKASNRSSKIDSTKKVEAFGLKTVDDVHTEVYYQYASAVIGLNCKTKRMDGTRASRPNPDAQDYMGTGAVISADGLILTSTTVIPEDGYDIRVYFTDGHVRAASLLKFDNASEGVLLKLVEKTEPLPYMKLARSEEYLPGEPVYSWGNPYNSIPQDGTVSLSLGQLSGRYKVSSTDDQSRYIGPVLETDAAVNPGSDGGPLTDAEGNLLGIMSLAFSPSRWLGLVIPTERLIVGIPELASQQFGSKPKWEGNNALVWSRQLALQAAALTVQDSVVGLWVVRKGDKQTPPENRKKEELAAQDPYPMDQRRAMLERMRPPNGCCSGLIVEADGTVITSAFNVEADGVRTRDPRNPQKVVEAKREVTDIFAFLADGSRVPCKLLALDATYDLAVLKLLGTRQSYPFLSIKDPLPTPLGSSVVLLGRSEPPGEVTVNIGSVSAIQRERGMCYQISTLMNYGNLGGPIVDISGRFVGMASHLDQESSWRQNCGVGFCLLAENIKKALEDVKAGRMIQAPQIPFLGVALDFSSEDDRGVVVKTVVPNSPASKGGMKDGDIISTYQGRSVGDGITLLNQIGECKVGEKIKFGVVRSEGTVELEVIIGSKGA